MDLRGSLRNIVLLAEEGRRRKEWWRSQVFSTLWWLRLGMEQARHSMALSNHTSSNVVLSESQSNDALVCPLSPAPSSIVLSRVSQWSSLKGKEVVDKASDLGFPMSFSKAQISPSQEPTTIPSPFNEPINTP